MTSAMSAVIGGGAAGAGGRALRERLCEDGFVFLRGVLAADVVMSLRREIARVLVGAGLVEATAGDQLIPRHPLRLVGSPELDAAMAAIQSLESFHRLAFADELLSIMSAIGCDPVLVHPRKRPRLVIPEHLAANPMRYAHQDRRYIQGTINTYTAWIPLGPVPRAMGGLRVLPRSHLRGLHPVTDVGPEKCAAMDMSTSGGGWVTTDYEPGDVVIFGSLTVHAGAENRTSEYRLSMDCRYQPLAEAICSHELDPVRYPSIPSWSTLGAGWSTQRWVELPPGARVVPFDEALVSGPG